MLLKLFLTILDYYITMNVKAPTTRGSDFISLIGYPSETLLGAKLPSARAVMQNFIYYHRTK